MLVGAVVPSDGAALDQVRALLALVAIYLRTLASLPEFAGALGIQLAPEQLSEAAMQAAMELLEPR